LPVLRTATRPGQAESFRASDNYLWLEPGEVRMIDVNSAEGLKLEGWNLHPEPTGRLGSKEKL
jgi:hypothetical protein